MTAATFERPRTRKAPAGPEQFKHFVSVRDADLAVLEGLPVIALCGFQWGEFAPTDWVDGNPAPRLRKMPVCPECHRRYRVR